MRVLRICKDRKTCAISTSTDALLDYHYLKYQWQPHYAHGVFILISIYKHWIREYYERNF